MRNSLQAFAFAFLFSCGLALGACSSSDSDTPPSSTGGSGGTAGTSGSSGNGGTSAGGSAGTSAGGSAAAGGAVSDASTDTQEPHDAQPTETSAGLKVKVTYQNASNDVDINLAPLFQNGGSDYSLVSDVILVALPGKSLPALKANFVGSDGYNPADKGGCKSFVPVVGDKLKQGWINRSDKRLEWDPAAGMPGCMSIKDLEEILVEDN